MNNTATTPKETRADKVKVPTEPETRTVKLTDQQRDHLMVALSYAADVNLAAQKVLREAQAKASQIQTGAYMSVLRGSPGRVTAEELKRVTSYQPVFADDGDDRPESLKIVITQKEK